ncbi:F-box protein SKIP23-like isoform X1 [Spinacia oleracea]|uniref:F-box protein SKIP23-like isoform X1 n=1 Tax=Spinacia oleracea TaxID=3562 RepID=A0A9R0JPG7_SPIOL|nr:F-box protein SKIP23-like isoform X1 [Spinacia oleracea]
MGSHRKVPRTVDWSNPPPEILSAISKRLESGIDIFRCRSVCKNWRASINPNPNSSCLSPFLPRKISNPTLPFINRPNETLILFARTVFLVKPLPFSNDNSSWVLTVEEVIPGKLRVLYPLSTNRVTALPSNFPKYLNLADFSVSEIDRSYGFKYASDCENVCGVQKVVLCSASTAMVLYGEGTLIGVRIENGIWGFVRDSLVTSFSDVISFNGMISAVDYKGNLYTVDHKTMKVIKTVAVNLSNFRKLNQKRLVEREGKLLLVAWPPNGSHSSEIRFTVYNQDELESDWVPTILQGWVIFVGLDWCFTVFAQDLNICDPLPKKEVKFYTRDIQYQEWDVKSEDFLVYSQSCFDASAIPPLYNHQLFEGASIKLPIRCVFIRSQDKDRTNYLCGTITGALWPPPTWFLPDSFIFIRDDEESEEMNLWEQGVSADSKEKLPPSSIAAPSIGVANIPQGTNMHTVLGDSPALRIQDFNICSSTDVFEGVKIKSNLVHTLQNIWTKW